MMPKESSGCCTFAAAILHFLRYSGTTCCSRHGREHKHTHTHHTTNTPHTTHNKQTNNKQTNQTKPNQTKPNQTKQNKTKQNKTKQNQTKPNQTKPNQTKQNKTKQNKTKQNKTKQNKTKQNKTKQNKTKQNKTKQTKQTHKPKQTKQQQHTAGNRGDEVIGLGVHRVSGSCPVRKRFRLNRRTLAQLAGLLTHSRPRVWKRLRHVFFSGISMPDHTGRRCDHAFGCTALAHDRIGVV